MRFDFYIFWGGGGGGGIMVAVEDRPIATRLLYQHCLIRCMQLLLCAPARPKEFL